MEDEKGRARALANLGGIYEGRGDMALAVEYYQKYLSLSTQMADAMGQTLALGALGNLKLKRD